MKTFKQYLITERIQDINELIDQNFRTPEELTKFIMNNYKYVKLGEGIFSVAITGSRINEGSYIVKIRDANKSISPNKDPWKYWGSYCNVTWTQGGFKAASSNAKYLPQVLHISEFPNDPNGSYWSVTKKYKPVDKNDYIKLMELIEVRNKIKTYLNNGALNYDNMILFYSNLPYEVITSYPNFIKPFLLRDFDWCLENNILPSEVKNRQISDMEAPVMKIFLDVFNDQMINHFDEMYYIMKDDLKDVEPFFDLHIHNAMKTDTGELIIQDPIA